MRLPQKYHRLTPALRRKVREEYIRKQDGQCRHCKEPLDGPPAPKVQNMPVTRRLFPKGFFDWPVHLHHDHISGNTIGAVHARCNAVLWEHHGE